MHLNNVEKSPKVSNFKTYINCNYYNNTNS